MRLLLPQNNVIDEVLEAKRFLPSSKLELITSLTDCIAYAASLSRTALMLEVVNNS